MANDNTLFGSACNSGETSKRRTVSASCRQGQVRSGKANVDMAYSNPIRLKISNPVYLLRKDPLALLQYAWRTEIAGGIQSMAVNGIHISVLCLSCISSQRAASKPNQFNCLADSIEGHNQAYEKENGRNTPITYDL